MQTNPVGNLESLEALIGLTKSANKTSTDAVGEYMFLLRIITEIFLINSILLLRYHHGTVYERTSSAIPQTSSIDAAWS